MAMDAFTRKADKRMAKLQRQGKRSQQDLVVAVDVSKVCLYHCPSCYQRVLTEEISGG